MSKLGSELIKGLEEALKHAKGEIELRTTFAELQEDGNVKHEELKKTKLRIDKEPDGKRELDYGKEDLEKDPKDKKKRKKEEAQPVNVDKEGNARRPNPPEPGDLVKRWGKIKKALNSDDAFLDIEDASGLAEEQAEMEAQQGQGEEGEISNEQLMEMLASGQITEEDIEQLIASGQITEEQLMQVLDSLDEGGEPQQEGAEQEMSEEDMMAQMMAEEGGEGEITEEQLMQMLTGGGGGSPEEEAMMAQMMAEEGGEVPPEGEVSEEDIMAGEAAEGEVVDQEGAAAGEQYAEENPEMVEDGEGMSTEEEAQMLGEMTGEDPEQIEEEMSPEEIEEQLTQAMLEEGYSETEIAYILHGHGVPALDPVDQSKIQMNEQKSSHQQVSHEHDIEHKRALAELEREHKRRMNDTEYEERSTLGQQSGMQNEHKKRMLDLEYQAQKEAHRINDLDLEHKKRMLDLEYETTKKEKEIELEAKRKEMELKLREKEKGSRDKVRHSKEMSSIKHEQRVRDAKRDAASTSKAEMKGLKKGIEDIEDLQKAMKLWNHNLKDGNLHVNHPTHGTLSVIPNKEAGTYDIKHNGKLLGTHGNTKDAAKAAYGHIKDITLPKVVK